MNKEVYFSDDISNSFRSCYRFDLGQIALLKEDFEPADYFLGSASINRMIKKEKDYEGLKIRFTDIPYLKNMDFDTVYHVDSLSHYLIIRLGDNEGICMTIYRDRYFLDILNFFVDFFLREEIKNTIPNEKLKLLYSELSIFSL